jgi:DNA polymerase III subunit epsilon
LVGYFGVYKIKSKGMSPQFEHSFFYRVLFPQEPTTESNSAASLRLQTILRYQPSIRLSLLGAPVVIFDFETTGLNPVKDEIIEIGAKKIFLEDAGAEELEFATLVKPSRNLSDEIKSITGLDDADLAGVPNIEHALPEFIQFIKGSILVAHNADFDWAFLKHQCEKQGVDISWPCLCTLKMARIHHRDLESRNLDQLARHYGLSFDSRHRSIGDVRVTSDVFKKMIQKEAVLEWGTLRDHYSVKG